MARRQGSIKVAEKSRRVGLTWAEAADSALIAAARQGMDTWYLGYNHDMAREFVETAASWARQFNKAARAIEQIAMDDERHDIIAYRIRFELRPQNRGAVVAALQPAREAGTRRNRRGRLP